MIFETELMLFQFGQFRTIGEKDVQLAVVVVIENGDSATHGLRKVFTAGGVVIRRVGNPAIRGDVDELRALGRELGLGGHERGPKQRRDGDDGVPWRHLVLKIRSLPVAARKRAPLGLFGKFTFHQRRSASGKLRAITDKVRPLC